MKYNPPTNGDLNNPDRPFINADPSNGVPGSYPSAQSIEHPQREILNVILGAGLVPDGDNLQQLHEAIIKLVSNGALPLAFFRRPVGLNFSNNAIDQINDVDIQPGFAVDDSSSFLMYSALSQTKRLDALWSEGTNGGLLDIGAKSPNTAYYLFQIYDPLTKKTDYIASTSSAPVLPANFSKKRRIGFLFTNAAGSICPFTQRGDRFYLDTATPLATIISNAVYTTPQVLTLGLPGVTALISFMARASSNISVYWQVFNAEKTRPAIPSSTDCVIISSNTSSTGEQQQGGEISCPTSSMGQVKVSASSNSGSHSVSLQLRGWIDERI